MLRAACDLFAPLRGSDKLKETKEGAEAAAGAGWKFSMPELPSILHGEDDKEEPISPFLVYEDGYAWPDLYSEVDEMLECCVLLHPLVELRRLARAGELPQEQVLRIPLTRTDVWEIVEEHKHKLVATSMSDEFSLRTLAAAKERAETHLSPTTIVAIDDEFEKEELVYSVEVNERRKRVTVCFRGSVTKTDWATNYEAYFKEVPNPMHHRHASQEETVRVHHGFHDYLFEASSRGVTGPNGEVLSEYQEILQEHVLPVLHDNPGFKLFICGHSLGGALATLFAFEVAAMSDNVIPKPVSLFSIASPYVGDYSFRAAHQALESLGKLRHLRISNHKDTVTIIPKMSIRLNVFDRESHVGYLFKHVGINLRLYDGASPLEFTYARVRSGFWSSTFDELSRGWDQSLFANWSWNLVDHYTWPYHSLKEYTERVEGNKPSLQSMHLNELYTRKELVGNLVAEF